MNFQKEQIELLDVLDRIEPIGRQRISFLYLVGLVVVSSIMILLPLLYAALVGLAAFGVYYHAFYSMEYLKEIHSVKATVFLYIGPLTAGVCLIVFTIKPFFAKPLQYGESIKLSPDREAFLFEFVNRMARIVGAPKPAEIQVDLQVNASAALIGGFMGLLRRKLRLTIGLPLVSGMSIACFSGVLAHELGHFSQGLGMRLSNLVESINIWFARMVYEPDSWDEYLKNSMEGSGCLLVAILFLSRLLIAASRWILWAFMMLGRTISCFFMRQMEYDADRMEIIFSGGKLFPETTKRLWLLSMAHQRANQDLTRLQVEEERLVDNWCDLVAFHSSKIGKDELKDFYNHNASESTSLFDTHPTDLSRIKRARKMDAPGCFFSDVPASMIFSDFSALAKSTTVHFYQLFYRRKIVENDLIGISDFEERKAQSSKSGASLLSYYFGMFSVLRPIPIEEGERTPFESNADAIRSISAAVENAKELAKNHASLITDYQQLDERMYILSVVMSFAKAGMRFRHGKYGLKNSRFETAYQEFLAIQERMQAANEGLLLFENAMCERILSTMRWVRSDCAREFIRDSDALRSDLDDICSSLQRLFPIMQALRPYRYLSHRVFVMVQHYEDQYEDKKYLDEFNAIFRDLYRQMESILYDLASIPYLFEHSEGRISLRKYVCAETPPLKEIYACAYASQEMVERLDDYYIRLASDLSSKMQCIEESLLKVLKVES